MRFPRNVMHRDTVFFGVMNRTAARVIRNQEFALSIEVTLANMPDNRFKVASSTGSNDTYFELVPNIVSY